MIRSLFASSKKHSQTSDDTESFPILPLKMFAAILNRGSRGRESKKFGDQIAVWQTRRRLEAVRSVHVQRLGGQSGSQR